MLKKKKHRGGKYNKYSAYYKIREINKNISISVNELNSPIQIKEQKPAVFYLQKTDLKHMNTDSQSLEKEILDKKQIERKK